MILVIRALHAGAIDCEMGRSKSLTFRDLFWECLCFALSFNGRKGRMGAMTQGMTWDVRKEGRILGPPLCTLLSTLHWRQSLCRVRESKAPFNIIQFWECLDSSGLAVMKTVNGSYYKWWNRHSSTRQFWSYIYFRSKFVVRGVCCCVTHGDLFSLITSISLQQNFFFFLQDF